MNIDNPKESFMQFAQIVAERPLTTTEKRLKVLFFRLAFLKQQLTFFTQLREVFNVQAHTL